MKNGATEVAPLEIWSALLFALRALGNESHLFGNREHEIGTGFEIGLRMADEEMGGDYAGTDDAASEHANGAAKRGADDHAATAYTSVFIAVLFQAGSRGDDAFRSNAQVGTGGGSNHCVELIFSAVFKRDGLRLEEEGTVTGEVAGRDLGHSAVDLGASGDHDATILHNVGDDTAAEGFTLLG